MKVIVPPETENDEAKVMEVSPEHVRKEIAFVLMEYGLVFSDTVPSDIRSDMQFLRKLRLSVEARSSMLWDTVTKALAAGFIALIVLGFVAWLESKGLGK